MKNNLKRQIKQLNSARTQYNPLRGITIQKVVSLLEQGERGEYCDLQWLYRMIEKRDAVLRALVRRRAAALLKLGWDIKMVPEDKLPKGTTVAQAEAQALALRTLYDGIDNLEEAIRFLGLAEFRGYAHLEKSFQESTSTNPAQIDALYPIEQWFWTRDGLEGDWMYDPDLRCSFLRAEEVDPAALVVREVEDPVNEIALIAFLRKNLSQKDWDGFVEVFGIPDVFFIMPQGLTEEQQTAWLTTAEQMAGDGRGAIPNGGDVKAVGGDVRGVNPFKEHLEYQDTMMVLAGTGGKLTMLSEATGIGGGATDAHDDAFDDLALAEAAAISGILRRNLDAPLLQDQFPNQPPLAYFDIAAQDKEDTTALITNIKTLSDAGIQIDVDDLSERTGLPLSRSAGGPPASPAPEEPPEDPPPAKAKNRRKRMAWWLNRQSREERQAAALHTACRKKLALAVALDIAPAVERLEDILDSTDDYDEMLQALERFQIEELPELSRQAMVAPAAADALADIGTANLFNGLEEGKKS